MKRSRIRFIFAYGTLMASEKSPRGARERALITAQCKPLGDASIRGQMFDTGDYPGAVLGAARGERIEGELWQLPDAPVALLNALDRYEGCAPDSPEPQPYARCRLRIRTADGRRVTAWIYLWVAPTGKLPRIPGGRWHTRSTSAHHSHTAGMLVGTLACNESHVHRAMRSPRARGGSAVRGGKISAAGFGLLKR